MQEWMHRYNKCSLSDGKMMEMHWKSIELYHKLLYASPEDEEP